MTITTSHFITMTSPQFIRFQTHQGDLDKFFKNENQAYPTSLADITRESEMFQKSKLNWYQS